MMKIIRWTLVSAVALLGVALLAVIAVVVVGVWRGKSVGRALTEIATEWAAFRAARRATVVDVGSGSGSGSYMPPIRDTHTPSARA